MSAKSQELANEFEAKAHDAVALLRQLTDGDWKKVTEAERWPVGVTAHHLAGALEPVAGMVTATITGRSLGRFTRTMLDEMNARHAVEHAACTKRETLALFERGTASALTVLRGVTDEDLTRSGTVFAEAPPMTAEQLIRSGLLGHIDDHIGSIRKTIAAPHPVAVPQAEHEWLQQLCGEWTYETEMVMEPGQPPVKCVGTETVRSLGGLWIVAEGQGEMPGAGPATTLMTLGYDPERKRYVGTFIASMMTHLWLYDGTRDATRGLLLDTEGPSMAGDGTMARYQDVIAIDGPERRVLTSYALGDDGRWKKFMTAAYRRQPSR